MRGEHIIDLLEQGPISALSDRDRAIVDAHVVDCSNCLRAYMAAKLSAELLEARASERLEPSPFFKSRLMAAIREKQIRQRLSLVAMWRAGRALVGSMAALPVVLLALTFYPAGSGDTPDAVEASSSEDLYSAEWLILENGDATDELTDSQVLETLYDLSNTYGEQ